MQIETSRFGTMDIDETGIVNFPDGLPGFESQHRFVFIPHRMPDPDKASPFMWFQSMDDGKLAFLMTNPKLFFPDYDPSISTADRAALDISDNTELHTYALLTVPSGNPSGITANLLAPIMINIDKSTARQVVVNDDRYTLRHRLIPDVQRTAPAPEIVSRSVTVAEEYVVHR
jgi:flagellar assembly factor FliW